MNEQDPRVGLSTSLANEKITQLEAENERLREEAVSKRGIFEINQLRKLLSLKNREIAAHKKENARLREACRNAVIRLRGDGGYYPEHVMQVVLTLKEALGDE